MLNFNNITLELIICNLIISVILIIIYDLIKFHGKLYLNIFKMKINILNKNNWNETDTKISNDTKFIELDFILQVYNHKNNYNSIYNLGIYKKTKFKDSLIENHYLNLVSTMKSVSGTTSYEKLKYINLLPYEIKEYHLKIKLTKGEFERLKKEPIHLKYKNKNNLKKLNLSKYLKKYL